MVVSTDCRLYLPGVGGLVVWSLSHEVTFVIGGAVMGIVVTTLAVVTRRQAGGGNQHSRDH
jgi:hypothetical protein